jgi:formate dehydrogenase gamma subunit
MDRGVFAGLCLTLALSLPVVGAGADQNAECLACHGEKEMRSESGRSIYVDAARQKASVHGSLTCTTCHTSIKEYPHPKRVAKVACADCHTEPAGAVPKSIHRSLGSQVCASCHGSPHAIEQAATVASQQCAACHGDAVREYRLSAHAQARKNGGDGPTCASCHGTAHKIMPARDPASPVAKRNLPDTCGSCHADPDFLERHQIPFARPVEAYRLSVHDRALAAGNHAAPSCSDCHSNHAIFDARDPRAKINHWNVPVTCGACHVHIKNTYAESIHGQAVAHGVPDAPVCTDCHGEHTILAPGEPQSLVNPARVSSVTCGRCHADERLTQRYNLPADKVPAFEDSYHGLAMRAGSQVVANCASCHGVHNILPSSDPHSTVNPANLARTCGACHAGAGQRFAIGPVHVRPATASENAVVKWIRVAYLILIPLAVGFMFLHNLLDFLAKLVRGGSRIVRSGEEVTRMNRNFRIAHWLVVVSFPVLVVTGFALKFPESWWAQPLLRWEGRFALRGAIHRTAAVVLIAALVYHIVHLVVSRRDRVILRFLRPGVQDVFDLVAVVRYNLGLTDHAPHFGKFNYSEKIEYLAFLWGSAVMAASGFLLWFDNFTLRHFPKWVADAATAVHYYEAILATLSILLWHFYMTIFDPDVYPMDRAWLTGKTSADHLRHTRPAYYLELRREQQQESAQGADGSPQGPITPSSEHAAGESISEHAPAETQAREFAGSPPPTRERKEPSNPPKDETE